MNKKKQLIQLLEEKHKRKKLNSYQNNFTDFASDNIKIITKDARRGFVNFTFNDCQKKITEILDKQLADERKG